MQNVSDVDLVAVNQLQLEIYIVENRNLFLSRVRLYLVVKVKILALIILKLLPRHIKLRKNIQWLVALIALLAFGSVAAYQFIGGRPYSTDMKALRTQFNADKGKIRLVLLMAPT